MVVWGISFARIAISIIKFDATVPVT